MSLTTTPFEGVRDLGAARRMTLGSLCLILVQSGIGVATNLYVTIPRDHSGARPSNYFTGSTQSIGWSISHGSIILVIHVVFGFALVVSVATALLRTMKLRRRAITTWSMLGALLVVGAGFNGASFLDFNNAVSSLIMSLLALGSVACYGVVLFLLSETVTRHD